MEHDPLLPPGLHDVTVAELDNHFLSEFSDSVTRPGLIAGLRAFLDALRRVGVTCEVWIDGSFSTYKLDPNDVDLVVFASPQDLDQLDPDKQEFFAGLMDRLDARRKFGCDVLFAVAGDPNFRSYWRGWYGFDRHERPKGIAKLVVVP
jgi:hypothetical protein